DTSRMGARNRRDACGLDRCSIAMSAQKRRRVLVFYADTGAGHRSVATAICTAIGEIAAERIAASSVPVAAGTPHRGAGASEGHVSCSVSPEWQVELHNPVAACNNPLLKGGFGLYAPVTRHAPSVFTGAYRISNSHPMCHLIRKALDRQMRMHLSNVIGSIQPDLIVSVNSLLTYPIVRAMRHSTCVVPLCMVVTDLASIHRSWMVAEVDRCFVPTAEARSEMLAHGMPEEKVWQSGLPIHPAYSAQDAEPPREALRASLGLLPRLFTVLIVGGGEGIGQLVDTARELAHSSLPLQLIVVAGRNRALYRTLEAWGKRVSVPQRIYGYAGNMPDLMRASNVIVTKAGSVTLAEALACGLPIVLSSVLEGQES